MFSTLVIILKNTVVEFCKIKLWTYWQSNRRNWIRHDDGVIYKWCHGFRGSEICDDFSDDPLHFVFEKNSLTVHECTWNLEKYFHDSLVLGDLKNKKRNVFSCSWIVDIIWKISGCIFLLI
jgi:hypothetical protein